jgi:hypothetical protein
MFYHLGDEKTTGEGEEGSSFVLCARATHGLQGPRSMRAVGDQPHRSASRRGRAWLYTPGELTPSPERRSLLLAFESYKEDAPWEFNRYRIGH